MSGTAPVQTAAASTPSLAGTAAAPTPRVTETARVSVERTPAAARGATESTAERRERPRQTTQQPSPVPESGASGRPNVVAYALNTSHELGEKLYDRSIFSTTSRFERNCALYPSADRAQEDFLANGGPERDRYGLDPDGDGFACFWDPSRYRALRGG